MSTRLFDLSQCETSDSPDGPWSDIEVSGQTLRYCRVKQAVWDEFCKLHFTRDYSNSVGPQSAGRGAEMTWR
jgi:hypothetical protein